MAARRWRIRLPLPVVLLLAKAAGWVSRLLRRGHGTSLPGLVATALYPGVLARLAHELPDGVVLVTGTNGKTTTCHLMRAGLSSSAARVVANDSGSNLSQGLVSALVRDRGLGRPRSTLGVFEVDEAALVAVLGQVAPRLVVVVNLFRDQLDRHAEVDQVAAAVGGALGQVDAAVLLNADDARVAALRRHARGAVAFFGLDEPPVADLPARSPVAATAADVSPCPSCGARLDYLWNTYAQLGGYACPACGLHRPTPSVAVTRARPADGGWCLSVRAGDQQLEARTRLRGVYNLYNVAAALATCERLGVPASEALRDIAASGPVTGRGAATEVGSGEVVMLLGKNPAGVEQVLQAHVVPEPYAPLLLVLNDAAADGRDVSWIWDAPLELLSGRLGPVLVAGQRAESMVLRLWYAEVPAAMFPSIEEALEELVRQVTDGARGFVLTTYTGVQPLGRYVARLGEQSRAVGSAA
jgi:lipid II isoglutaminyl synthase (glutamine-hydrolysing)